LSWWLSFEISVVTTYSTSGTGGATPNDFRGTQPHASGGDFLIPMGYGNEGFAMGNGDTASGGETVSITPKGQSKNNNSEVVNALKSMPKEIGRAVALALAQGG